MGNYYKFEEDIPKLFHQEVREKKRIGVNIFKRVSSRKGGSKYVSPYANLKPRQIKAMSGDVKVFNIYESVMPFNEFVSRPQEQQVAIMKKWRDKFPNKDIIKGLGCGKTQYYKTIEELGLKDGYKKRIAVKTTGNKSKPKSTIDINKYKDNLIDYKLFKKLNQDEKATLLFHYLKKHSIKELSLEWDVLPQYLHNIKSKFKNLIKDGKIRLIELSTDITEEEETDTKLDTQGISELLQETQEQNIIERDEYTLDGIMNTPMVNDDNTGEPVLNNRPTEEPIVIEQKQSTINISFTKELTPMEMLQQIQSLSFILESNKRYNFEFKVSD